MCDDQNHTLTSDSLQFIATQYGTEPIKLKPEVKEIEVCRKYRSYREKI